ncbi:MAG TPA: caspase family protein, partial [Spirochaetota bacterium]|nr:caspase family protein [Spirochaetota bacterium]
MWDIKSGKEIKTIIRQNTRITSFALSGDGKSIIYGTSDGMVGIYDIKSGNIVKKCYNHTDVVSSIVILPDGKNFVSGSWDGTIKFCNTVTGDVLFTSIATSDGEYLSWTPEGFFSGSEKLAREAVYIVDGMKITNIDQLFETYYRPDIVEAKARGDDIKKYVKNDIKNGIKTPPEVFILAKRSDGSFRGLKNKEKETKIVVQEDGTAYIKVIAKDNGGGINNIKLYLNDKIVGDGKEGLKNSEVTTSDTFEQEFTIKLMAGDNTLKAIAFSNDMTASLPDILYVTYTPPKIEKPSMYILGIGINEYRNSDMNLDYCVDDVKGFISAIEPKSKKLFNSVNTITLFDKEANKTNVIKTLNDIKSKIRNNDVFLLFYAGHGIVNDLSEGD